jgi:hypothetical protein
MWHKAVLKLLTGEQEEKLENLCLTTLSLKKFIAAKKKKELHI